MDWREASAAYEAGLLGKWPALPKWHKEWIIAIVETKSDIQGAMADGS
jgi:hypothetical protein